ncbi:MAG: MFS transporter [Nitrospinota bacterium]
MAKPRSLVWVLAGVNLFIMMGLGLVSPVLPLYAESFGVSYAAVGFLISVFPMLRLVTNLPGGVLGNRLGERQVGAAGAALVAFGAWVSGSAPTFRWLIAGQALQGLGSSLFVTNAMSFIMRVTPAERMGKTMSIYQGSFSLGVSVGPIVGGFLASLGGFRLPFFVYGVLAAVSCVLTWVYIQAPAAERGAPKRPGLWAQGREVRRLFSRYEFVLSLLLTAMIFWIRAGLRHTTLPLYARDVAGVDTFRIGLLLSVITVTNLLVLWPAGRAVDRSRKAVAVGSSLAVAFSAVALGWADSFSGLILASLFFGVTTGFCGVPPTVIASDVMPSSARGGGLGVFRMAGDIGFITGPILSGFAITHIGYAWTFWVFAAGALIVFGLTLKMKETLRPGTPRPQEAGPLAREGAETGRGDPPRGV